MIVLIAKIAVINQIAIRLVELISLFDIRVWLVAPLAYHENLNRVKKSWVESKINK